MAFNFILPLRATQFVFAIIVLGTTAYGTAYFRLRSRPCLCFIILTTLTLQ